MRRSIFPVLSLALFGSRLVAAALPEPTFYCTFDHCAGADYSRGKGGEAVSAPDALLYEASLRGRTTADPRPVSGMVGKARRFNAGADFAVEGNFNPRQGTIMMWVQPSWRGDREDLYASFFGCKNWGLLYKYTTQTYITFGWIKDDGNFNYGCSASIEHWQPGEWHHLAVTYDAAGSKKRVLYLDGKRVHEADIPSFRECVALFTIGASYGGVNPSRSALDELVLFDRPLNDGEVLEGYETGRQGLALFPGLSGTTEAAGTPTPPAGPKPALPAFVNWELPDGPLAKEWCQANARGGRIGTATRERVSLNGIWRFRPDAAATWHYLRVPGSWHPGERFKVRSVDGKTVTSINEVALKAVADAWYERTFELPAGWRDQRIVLGIDSIRATGDVFLNGRHLGRAWEFQRHEFDVSSIVKPGDNLLQIRVHSLRPDSTFRGLDEDVWLECRPVGPLLKWVALHPLVSKGKLAVEALVTDAAGDLTVRIELLHPDRTVVGRGTGSVRNASASFTFATPNLKPWHPDTPNLYFARVELWRDDTLVDALYPQRFGYRQLEIRGGDFFLNGRRFHVRGQAAPPFGNINFNAVEANIREWFGTMKAVHVNAIREYARGWSSGKGSQWRDLYYDIADEMGLIIFSHVPSNRALMNEFSTPPLPELYQARVADHVQRYGNHACTAMWFLNFNHGAHVGDLRPDLLDGSFEPKGLAEKEVAHAWMDFSEKVLTDIDSSRPVFHHAAGNYGQVFTLMTYLGFGIPLQEREEWPSGWAATRFKPLMPVETGFPCLLSNYRARRGALGVVYASEQLTPEYFAAYVGDRVYANLTTEEVRALGPGSRVRMDAMKRSVNYDEQKALFAKWTLRSWRTYGISGYCQHVEWRDCFTSEPEEISLPVRDPRDFGLVLDRDKGIISRHVDLTRLGEVARVNNAPLLAYIAGPEQDFVDKAHAFTSGEEISNAVVLINDTAGSVTFAGNVAAQLRNQTCYTSKIVATVDAGQVKIVPVRFTAPQTAGRATGVITLTLIAGGNPFEPDSFAWECFPELSPPTVKAPVALLDPVGRTAAVMTKAGVDTSSELRPDTRLLVIGREALDKDTRSLLKNRRIMARVQDGLNVLVFEQTGQQLAGLPMDDPNCRAAFIRAPNHPVLRGLTNADLRHWRGQSDLSEPYPKYSRTDLSWGQGSVEFVRWGNRGVVCSFAPEKPQRGRFTVLVDADYDLLLAPLLEWRIGKGRIIFCQLDITHRYGFDPVPTLLVNRLLEYLTRPVDIMPPQAMFVDAAWDGKPEDLAAFVSNGGRALLSGDASPALIQHLFGGGTSRQEVSRVTVPGKLAERGVAPGDFFWRECKVVPVLTRLPAGVIHTSPPVVALRRVGRGEVLWCGVTPAGFTDCRYVAKVTRLMSILLQAGDEKPDLTEAKPRVGEPGSPYAVPSLGFNPYHYRRW